MRGTCGASCVPSCMLSCTVSCMFAHFNNRNTLTTNILTKNRSFFCEKVKNPSKKTGYF